MISPMDGILIQSSRLFNSWCDVVSQQNTKGSYFWRLVHGDDDTICRSAIEAVTRVTRIALVCRWVAYPEYADEV